MYITITIESKNGIPYEYDVELELEKGEYGSWMQPSVADSYNVIRIEKDGKDITKKLTDKIKEAIQTECDNVMENY